MLFYGKAVGVERRVSTLIWSLLAYKTRSYILLKWSRFHFDPVAHWFSYPATPFGLLSLVPNSKHLKWPVECGGMSPLVGQWERWHSPHRHCTWAFPSSPDTVGAEQGGAGWSGGHLHHLQLQPMIPHPAQGSDCGQPGSGSYLKCRNTASRSTDRTFFHFSSAVVFIVNLNTHTRTHMPYVSTLLLALLFSPVLQH